MSDSVRPQRRQPTRPRRPWDSPGKNPGVGCHFLLQCMKVKSESEVAQSCPTLSDPMDSRLPGSSIHGILQSRVLEWVAIAFSRKKELPHQKFTTGVFTHLTLPQPQGSSRRKQRPSRWQRQEQRVLSWYLWLWKLLKVSGLLYIFLNHSAKAFLLLTGFPRMVTRFLRSNLCHHSKQAGIYDS